MNEKDLIEEAIRLKNFAYASSRLSDNVVTVSAGGSPLDIQVLAQAWYHISGRTLHTLVPYLQLNRDIFECAYVSEVHHGCKGNDKKVSYLADCIKFYESLLKDERLQYL